MRYLISSLPVSANPIPVTMRQKAIGVAIALTSGAYQTSLVSYFTHRDLFPSLMKVSTACSSLIWLLRRSAPSAGCSLNTHVFCLLPLTLSKFVQESDSPAQASHAFLLLGLLANYNKFEFRNPYRLRLEDFVNEATIRKILKGLAYTCSHARDRYLAEQEDVPEGWNLTSTLTYIGLGALVLGKTAAPSPNTDNVKEVFAAL